MLKSELLGSSVGEKPPSELERGDEAAFSDRIGGERGIDRERRTKVLHPSRGWEHPDRVGMAKTEIPVKLQVGTSVKVHVTHRTYPEPPSRFRESQDVEVMWLRYEGYRDGKEPLTAMAYFCLTVVEARSGPKGQKRPNAAKQLKVEPKVLSKLGELSSQVGDNQKARKWGIHLTQVTTTYCGWPLAAPGKACR